MSNSVQPHRLQPTRLLCPWGSPGKNTGVGCHFLLQCMKVKSESEVAQSCPTLCNPTDCSPPGSSVYGILQARILEWVAMRSSRGSSPWRGWNLYLLHWQADSFPSEPQGPSPQKGSQPSPWPTLHPELSFSNWASGNTGVGSRSDGMPASHIFSAGYNPTEFLK